LDIVRCDVRLCNALSVHQGVRTDCRDLCADVRPIASLSELGVLVAGFCLVGRVDEVANFISSGCA